MVSGEHAQELLEAFRAAGVAACAAPAQQPWTRDPDYRLWVDPDRYAAAENVLLHEMSKEKRQ